MPEGRKVRTTKLPGGRTVHVYVVGRPGKRTPKNKVRKKV